MSVPTVHLKLRVKLPNGSRAYVESVYSANNKLKPLFGIVDGNLQLVLHVKVIDFKPAATEVVAMHAWQENGHMIYPSSASC